VCFGKRAIPQWLFARGICTCFRYASHNQTFVVHQDRYSARETAIRNLRFASWPEKHHVRRYKPIRPLQIKQREVLSDSECYPYDDMNLDFDKNRCRFFTTRTHVSVKTTTDTISSRIKLSPSFRHNDPFVIIDCSRQNESIKSATVNVRIEFDCKENILMNITVLPHYTRSRDSVQSADQCCAQN